GSFTYTPQANYHGTDTFTYKANDGTTDSAAATVTITINSINDAPLAVADSYTVNVGGTLTTTTTNGVLANDTDADGNALTAAVVTQPTHGTLTFNTNGTFTYTPTAGYRGTDSFTYKANDGNVNSAAATVTIKVNAVPVAAGDSFSVNEDAVLTVSVANGVLVNDTDADSDTLTPTVVTQPAHGTVSMNANGTFTYTPAANYHGTDSFTYKVNDGTADSADATVTITVAPVNDAPVAAADAYSVDEDNVLTVDAASGVLDNDSDVDSTTVTAAIVTLPAHGTLSLANDGSFTYTPAADYHGTDTFTYKANDGTAESAEATVTITVNSVNDVPSVNDDSYSVPVGGSLTVQASSGVAANDTDADGNSLTVSVATGPSNGQLTLNADGSFTYTPNASFHGTDTFTYTVNDGTVDSAVATVTIDVNTLANTVNDAYTIDEDGTLTVDADNGVLKNDGDVDGDTLSVALATGPSHGTLTLNTDGSFEYKPEADFHGTDTFTYVVNDGFGDSAAATVTITVSSINDVPVANDDSYSVPVGGTLTVQASSGVAANDTDADGDSLTVSVATGPSNGQLTLNADGSFTYTPNADFHGTDTFTYTVNDGTVDSAVATVTIDVNTLANTVNDAYTIAEDGTLTVDAENGVLTNDSDVDGDTLSVALATGPSHGTLTLNTDGSFEYKPEADFHGTDTFTYVVNDGFGNSAAATVTITVNPVNDAPVVADDSYDVTPNVVLSVDAASGVLANDSDADDDSLEVTLLQGPAHGTLLMNADGSFTYTPNQDYEGPDSFTYTVDDGTVDSLAATVSLTVGTQAADEALAGEEDWT
ncbi:MAG: tandem-95 repeat protein, partial [Planctomycetaceae bacterium]|nr:tandem-95 repeat protein [Planctomycetaceae bacterium]